ncbi:MAG: GtrA family protein [Chitinophagaceae bacterium]|jgi:putative flippase GtrA|nr:GtrA family protein [Chitinophagaceae bacterium]
MTTTLIKKLASFGMVGITGIVIDFGITWILKERLKVNKYLANACGFTAAVINNFFLNTVFTFKEANSDSPKHLAAFICIALIGLLLNTGVLKLLQQYTKFGFYFAKAITIGLVFFWNFFANHYINYSG